MGNKNKNSNRTKIISHRKHFYSPFHLWMSNNLQELKKLSLSAVLVRQKYAISFTYCLTAVTPN